MTDEERLLEFLYVAPVALIQFDAKGNVLMANPRVAQLFNRYAPGGYFANFFTFLDEFLPELKAQIVSFDADNGQIMENKRFCLQAPSQNDSEELWMDVTIMRQESERYIASLNNVTEQVRLETEKFVSQEYLKQLLDNVNKHVAFTLTPDGVIDSWNRTGEKYVTSSEMAVGKLLSQLFPIEIAKNAEILDTAKSDKPYSDSFTFKDKSGSVLDAHLFVSAIHDQLKKLRGYSVVMTIPS